MTVRVGFKNLVISAKILSHFCLVYLLYIFKCSPDYILLMGQNNMGLSQTLLLIWVHFVCNIGYKKTSADEKAVDNCCEGPEKS